MKMPNQNNHKFSEVPQADIPRSTFDRSHGYKTTMDAGYLVPVFCDEALPGDTFNCKMTGFARLATPIHPFMDNMYLNSFFFAVPVRLLWQNWEKFNGAQDNPADSTDYTIPQIAAPVSGWGEGSIADYFGIPTGVASLETSALWHRAYNLIWNEWFRDENLQDSVPVPTDDGPDPDTHYSLLRRGKRHDYFTSALPWPQKGDSVSLPLGQKAEVHAAAGASTDLTVYSDGLSDYYDLAIGGGGKLVFSTADSATPVLYADLANASAATINQLRQSFQIQKLYERDARGGTRYIELIKSHFGVTSPDARLQRPEYLGGGQSDVNINPVAQTSSTDATTPQGNLSAFGTSTMQGHGFTHSFTEHCVVIGLVSLRADLNYQQGLNKMWSRSTRWDYYWPALSMIGEQAVLNKEIYLDGSAADDDVFGYQERYAEYRYKPSVITGAMRSSAATPLDTWHLAQDFASLPTLNDTFIQEDPPVDRVIAVPSEPHILFDSHFSLKCARPMPVYGVPGLIDHF